ncbi:MAG TPA: hypothetical protein PLH67_14630 [Lentisphaeria bacterium]|nr:hypothetical protein [Lentisphaeria bacterium]
MKNPMDRQLEKRLSIAPSPSAAMATAQPSANYWPCCAHRQPTCAG